MELKVELNKWYRDGLGRDVWIVYRNPQEERHPLGGVVVLGEGKFEYETYTVDGKFQFGATADDDHKKDLLHEIHPPFSGAEGLEAGLAYLPQSPAGSGGVAEDLEFAVKSDPKIDWDRPLEANIEGEWFPVKEIARFKSTEKIALVLDHEDSPLRSWPTTEVRNKARYVNLYELNGKVHSGDTFGSKAEADKMAEGRDDFVKTVKVGP